MKRNLLLLPLMLIVTACNTESYTVQCSFLNGREGEMAYLYSYYNEERIDSALIKDGICSFTEKITEPDLCRVENGSQNEFAVFIAEKGKIEIATATPYSPSGTAMNDSLASINRYDDSINVVIAALFDTLGAKYQDNEELLIQKAQEVIVPITEEYTLRAEKLFNEYTEGPIALYLFYSSYFELLSRKVEPVKIVSRFGPWLSKAKGVKNLIEEVERIAKTAEGKIFTDFSGTSPDGKKVSLSDYVGKGDYVLVDFWASWCRPCMGEIPFLKELYDGNKEKNFTILGIYVWDRPENLSKAMEKEGIVWPQIIDSEESATSLYGIQGIPMIILFGPDGKILHRGLRGEEDMVEIVESYLN